MEEMRYRKALAKTLGLSPRDVKGIIYNVRTSIYERLRNSSNKLSDEELAKYLNNNIKDAIEKKIKERRSEAKENAIKPFGIKYKTRIIELYRQGHGYAAIHKILKEECGGDEIKKVISASTIRKYLHLVWNVSKDRNRRIPVEAIKAKKSQ